MADTEVFEQETSEGNTVANEAVEKSVGETKDKSTQIILDQPISAGLEVEDVPKTNLSQQNVEISQELSELNQGSKTTVAATHNSNKGDDQYIEVEEEYEEEYEEDGEIKVVTKKQFVRVKKSLPTESNKIVNEDGVEEEHKEEVLDGNGEPIEVIKPDSMSKEMLIEKEEELEKEQEDEKVEIISHGEKQIVEELDKSAISFEEIEEEYQEHEVDENGDEIIVIKKRIIKVPKQITEDQEEKHEIEKSEKSEGGIEETEGEEEIEEEKEEETEDIEVKKEKEEEEEKEQKSESEKKSLSSEEKLLEEEKIAMAQQYQILTKLRNEHIALKRRNMNLNNMLVQYFKKQKMDHVFTETKEDPALEQQYLRKLTLFNEINQQMTEEKLRINTEWEAQRSINDELMEKLKKGWEELFSRKREIAAKLIDPKTGRTVPCDKTIEELLKRQETQLKLISECRLAQIKLKRRIEAKKMERQMQHAGKEFNLMDYEKLSSLKEYYLDKITERDIEIQEVNQKMTAMDDKLVQLKEQLQKKEEELEKEQERLQKVSLELNNKRANLNELKAARHKTEKITAKIKQQSGLLAYPTLMKDYQEKTEQLQTLESETDALKQVHRAAVARIRKLRETIKRREGPLVVSSSNMTLFDEKTV